MEPHTFEPLSTGGLIRTGSGTEDLSLPMWKSRSFCPSDWSYQRSLSNTFDAMPRGMNFAHI